MALKPNIPGDVPYEVSFQASSQNNGATLLTVGWIPNQGLPVPATSDLAIAPGATDSLKGRVPAVANVRRMEIRADLPDGGALGTLTLKIDGKLHTHDRISEDTTWTCLVS